MKRKLSLGIGVALILAGGYGVWFATFRTPTPSEASRRTFHRALDGDVAFLYRNASEDEKKLISEQTLSEFYEKFVRPEIEQAKIVSEKDQHLTPNAGFVAYSLKLPNGKVADMISLGYVENGKLVTPAFESVFYLYASVKYCEIPQLAKRLKPAWKDVSPWLHEKGVNQWYSSQDGMTYRVPGAVARS